MYMGCLQGREGKGEGRERSVNGCIPRGVGGYALGYAGDGASTSSSEARLPTPLLPSSRHPSLPSSPLSSTTSRLFRAMSPPARPGRPAATQPPLTLPCPLLPLPCPALQQQGGLSSLAQAPKPNLAGPLLRPGLLAQRTHGQRERDSEMEAVVAEATHYSKFALAPYGWPLYVWAHPRCGACDLCCACGIRHPLKHRPCFSRCSTCGGREGAQDALDVAALVRFANLDEDDILHVSFENGVLGALPYFIARDSKTQSIVLSVRGTLSVADCITDLLYEPAGLDGTLLGSNDGIPAGSMAHNGVLGCARALHADLQKRGTLGDALDAPQHRGWTLIITGHSLGAGVATLLGLMLRSWRPELKVWAFSPPGGLVSENLADSIKPWCTSVALGNDFISRLSMHNLERLRDEMMQCAALCKLPKFTVLRKAAISGPALRVRFLLLAPPRPPASTPAGPRCLSQPAP